MILKTSHISDTHNDFSHSVGSGHILFHYGDATIRGSIKEIFKFSKWVKSQLNNFEHIVIIPGNHDLMFEKNEAKVRQIFADRLADIPGASDRVHILINQSVELYGYKIYGSPYSIRYHDWAFMKSGEPLWVEWDKIPKDVEILMTHTPPFGILDFAGPARGNLGCPNLMYRIEQNNFPNLILHGFGHIHEANGFKDRGGVAFINPSVGPTLAYVNRFSYPWQITFEDKKIIDATPLGEV